MVTESEERISLVEEPILPNLPGKKFLIHIGSPFVFVYVFCFRGEGDNLKKNLQISGSMTLVGLRTPKKK